MRVQQLVLSNLDAILKPHGLTFARYEALVLLVFSARGSLPMGKMGSGSRCTRRRSPRSSTGSRLPSSSYDVRIREDRRAVLAEVTDTGRRLVEAATADLVAADFGLGVLTERQLRSMSSLLRPVRKAAGDF